MAMAASKLVTLPFQMVVSLWFVRRHVAFSWTRCLGCPLEERSRDGQQRGRADLRGGAVRLGLGSCRRGEVRRRCSSRRLAGWSGVLVTRHPVLLELRRIVGHLAETSFVRRLRSRAGSHAARQEANGRIRIAGRR